MFVKYGKTYRIDVPQIKLQIKKATMPKDEVKRLLTGRIVIEEKLDGGNTGILRTNTGYPGYKLQKKGDFIGHGEHAQYRYFQRWAANNEEKIIALPVGVRVFTELLYARHTVPYTRLPSYVCVLDVLSSDGVMLDAAEASSVIDFGFRPPVLYEGPALPLKKLHSFIGESHFYDGPMEGIVVKNHEQQMRGKIVRPEVMKEVEESDHWRDKPVVKNGLAAAEVRA